MSTTPGLSLAHGVSFPDRFARIGWPFLLAAGGAFGSLAFACAAPFVAIAAMSGATLAPRMALATILAMWVANQAVGFSLLDYPQTVNTAAWGLAIGVAVLAATAAAALASRRAPRGGAAAYIAAFAAAFLIYEGVLFAASFLLGGGEGLALEAVHGIATLNALWFAALAGVHWLRANRLAIPQGGAPGLSGSR